jgi:hypothetical protein
MGACFGVGQRPQYYENRAAKDPDMPLRILNGFAMITLDGPNIQEAFYDENGGIAWSNQDRD